MSFDLDKIYGLLPAIHRIRDTELGGPLKSLLSVIAEQAAVLEEDLAQSYDDHFIETCANWVVPYIGDLIGYQTLSGSAPEAVTPRAEVANTIGYRRRKGTLVALEQLARDVTGWQAHAVEFFNRLATTQYMNHLRPANTSPYIGGLARDLATGGLSAVNRPLWEPLERLNTPFDTLNHTFDARRIPPGRGRYNIPNIGIFLWRLTSYGLTNATPRQLDARRFFFSPLGNDTPLFTFPRLIPEFSGLSNRLNVPDPISRRTLAEYLTDYYGPDEGEGAKSLLLTVGGQEITADQVIVCDLSDVPSGGWAHQPAQCIAVDPVLGRVAFPSSQPAPADVRVSFHYGFSTAMGGGEYDRTSSVPEAFLAASGLVWQIGVTNSQPLNGGGLVATIAEALDAWNAQPPGTTGVIAIMDSSSYDLPDAAEIVLPAGSRLLMIAAGWPLPLTAATRTPGQFDASGCRPHLRGNITVSGQIGSEIYLNGLLLEGSVAVDGDALAQVCLRHCTLVPGLSLAGNYPRSPREPSLVVTGLGVPLEVAHSITGGLRVAATVTTTITGSIVDGTSRCGVAYAGLDGYGAGGPLTVQNSTILGKVHVSQMSLASNTIFYAQLAIHDDGWTAPVWCDQRQSGCIRYSYVPPGSRTPRRYRCQPANDEYATRVMPQFSSLLFGEPAYAQLSRRCAAEIFSGADDESEMGAFHDLYEPQRISNLTVRLGEYLRFGLEAGIFFEPKIETRGLVAQPYGYGAVPLLDLCGDEISSLPGVGAGLI